MKYPKIINYLTTLLLCFVGFSCQDKYQQFDSEYSSVRFVYNKAKADSIVYSFALHPGINEDVVEIPLKIIGVAKPIVREVGIEVIKDNTSASDNNFAIQKCEIAKDEYTGTLKVTVKKTDEISQHPVAIDLHLSKNQYFEESPINESHFKVIIMNKLVKPSDWPDAFGIYSTVKHEFVIQVTQRGTDYHELDSQEIIYYVGLLNKALYEYNKEHPGHPLTDENGLPITF